MSERTHDWEFSGELIDRTDKELSSGKTVKTLTISAKRGDYEHLCVCDYWSDPPDGLVAGATVTAAGRMNGREYNGRHYAGLTAVRLSVDVAGDVAGEPATAPPNEDTGDYSSGGDAAEDLF